MKHFLIILLASCPFLGLFSMQAAAEDSETPKYTDEQLQKLKVAEEKYKDNPQIMNMINKLKENSGITDSKPEKDPQPEPVMAHGKVITQGSYQDADAALRDNDMETTIANYRIMAEEGDSEVSVKLGYIYETEGDPKAAYAAYKQAAESEDDNEARKMALERMKWLEENGQVDQAEAGSSGTSMAKQSHEVQYRSVTPSLATESSSPVKSAVYSQTLKPRRVIISPERISKVEHFKPEKFTRTPES
jgi:hypothetical protein